MKQFFSFLVTLCVTQLIFFSKTEAQCSKPVIIGAAATVCPGTNTSLTTSTTAGTTYLWSTGATTPTIVAGAGTYTVTTTDAGGCSQTSDPVVITEKTEPALTVSDAPELCSGQSLTLFADTGNTWQRKTDLPFTGGATSVAFAIGSKGYDGCGTGFGTGDWWEYDEATDTWTQKADVPGGPRYYATGFALNGKGYVGLGYNSSTAFSDFWEYDPFANTWTAKADYPGGATNGAVSFTAGSLAYVGLGSSSGHPSTFWSFNPVTNIWTSIASFPGGGRRESVAFGINNKGYVTCGWVNASVNTNDCWEYNPPTDTWTAMPSLPGIPRRTMSAFSIQDHAYIVCGYGDVVGNLDELWEFYNGAWTKKASYPGGAQWGTASFGLHDKGYVFCGISGSRQLWTYYPNKTVQWPDGSTQVSYTVNAPGSYSAVIKDIEGCTVSTNPISITAKSFTATIRSSGAATFCNGFTDSLFANGNEWTKKQDFPKTGVYATGFSVGSAGYYLGNTSNQLWKYDAASDTWTQQANAPSTFLTVPAVTWHGRVYILGSFDKTIWEYDPAYNGWSKKAQFPGAAIQIMQGFLLNDQLIVAGGLTSTGASAEVWSYDLTNDTWTRKSDMPYTMSFAPAFALDGKGYLCTGNSSRDGGGTGTPQSAVCLQYDPVADSWTAMPDFPGGPRGGGIAFTNGHKAYVGLGNNGPILNDLWEFDPVSQSWTRMQDIPSGSYGAATFVIGNLAYVVTGANSTSKDVWQYEMPYDYEWSNGATTQFIKVTNSGDYSVKVDTPNGCSSTSPTVHITVLPQTVINTQPADVAVCDQSAANFSVNASGTSLTYQWRFNGTPLTDGGIYSGATSTALSIANVNGLDGSKFDCVVTGTCGVLTSSAALLTVHPLPAKPVITPGSATTFCNGGTVTLTSSAASGNAWSNGATATGINVATSGTFTVQVTDAYGCVSPISDAINVTVNPVPAKPVITVSGATTFCEGGSVTLTSSAVSGNTWSNGSNAQSITVSTSGSYTVQVTNTEGCASPLSDPLTVTVNPLPSKPVVTASGPATFCEGGILTLSSSALSGNAWSDGEGTQSININTSGSYSVKVTDANGCTSPVSDAIAVTVNPRPAKPVITTNGPTTFCEGSTLTLTSSAASGNIWSNGSASQNIPVTTSGTFTVQVTSTEGCTSPVSNPVVVTINPVPAKPVITANGPATFCDGGTLTLTSSALSGNSWSNGSGSQSINVNTSGSYTAKVTNVYGCTSPVSDAFLVTVNPLPPKPVITADGATTFCEGGTLTLTSSAGSGNAWSDGSASQRVAVTASGSFTVQTTSAEGCASTVSDPVVVTVNPLPARPVITANGPTSFCEGNSVVLTTAAAAAYNWSNGSNASSVRVNKSGTYTVQVTDANGCTSPSSDAATIQVNPLPSGAITTVGPLVSGSTHYMMLTAPQALGGQYQWNTGENMPTIRTTTSGNYSVVVTTMQGCRNTFSTSVQIIDLTKVPNTFSPNHDGINDYWYVHDMDVYPGASVQIFNRYGSKVFEAKGPGIKWDGTSGGKELPAGVYFYVLDLKDGSKPISGWINLVK